MINVKDLVHGKEYWFCRLITSKRGDRFREKTKPTKVVYELFKEPIKYTYSSHIKVGCFKLDCYTIVDVYDKTETIECIFLTEDECIEYWNNLIHKSLDALDALHAVERARIEKGFIKKKGK
jgi:hypothetical protein